MNKKYTCFNIAPYISTFWHCHYCGMNNQETLTASEFRTKKEIKCDNCKNVSIVDDRRVTLREET